MFYFTPNLTPPPPPTFILKKLLTIKIKHNILFHVATFLSHKTIYVLVNKSFFKFTNFLAPSSPLFPPRVRKLARPLPSPSELYLTLPYRYTARCHSSRARSSLVDTPPRSFPWTSKSTTPACQPSFARHGPRMSSAPGSNHRLQPSKPDQNLH